MRKLVSSIVTSAVLVGSLTFSGCGGSHSSVEEKLPTLDHNDQKASGSQKIVADRSGNTNVKVDLISEKKNAKVAEATFTKVLKSDNTPACTKSTDNCKVDVKQFSACGIDSSNEAFKDAKSNVLDLIDWAKDHNRYDANKDMIVFGGVLTVKGENFDKCEMSVAINMIECGAAFTKDGKAVKAGFSNENHIVDVFVEPTDESKSDEGKWIHNLRIKDGKIIIPAGSLGTLSLPATFTFYSIKDSNKDNTTGITGGSTGATGGYGG